ELASDRPEDARADRLVLFVDEHGRVAVESNVAAVGARELALGADDHRARDLALLHLRARNRLADRHDDDIADRGLATPRAAKHLDAEHLLGAAVVGDVESRGHLDHDYFSSAPASPWSPASGSSASWLSVRRIRHRLDFDIGRASTISTTSPTLALLCSSCA